VNRDEAARQISRAVAELFFSAENQAKFMSAAEELGLSPPMLKGLLDLEPGQALPMSHLAQQWGCDASFVTVVVDGLEARGFVERRVATHDRRIKTVELTEAGAEARDRTLHAVHGPRAGFDALTRDEQVTVATLLAKMADAQARYDQTLRDSPDIRSTVRRAVAQRTREFRSRHASPPPDAGWKEQFEAHRQELRRLKDELARVRADIKAQARRPLDEAKAAKAAAKAKVRAEVKAAKDEVRSEVKGRRDDVVAQLRRGRPDR
jgi:DNA-binding MarR family transcriptional regulator